MYFRVFSYGKYTESGYFLGLQNFQIFFGGCFQEISDIFWEVNGRCWARAYV